MLPAAHPEGSDWVQPGVNLDSNAALLELMDEIA
jgi:hypothetical protein